MRPGPHRIGVLMVVRTPKRALLWLLFLAMAPPLLWTCGPAVPKAAPSTETVGINAVHAYYFHRTARCPDCLKIEAVAHDAVRTFFPVELESGALIWQSVNVDDEGQGRFVDDYALTTQSLVLSLIADGRELQWKNLEKVWEHVEDDQELAKYIEMEIRAYLADLPG